MAKNDYDFLVFRILVYLYGCIQRKISFDRAAFRKALVTQEVNGEYLNDILRFMQEEQLIEGLVFAKAWGNEYVLANEWEDMCLTPKGVRYLLENDHMKQIKETVLGGAPGAILELVKLVFTH